MTAEGKLPKRLAKAVYDKYSYKLGEMSLGFIGQQATQDMFDVPLELKAYFRQDFNWNRGDYADPGSCLWTCHKGTRRYFQDKPNWYSFHLIPKSETGGVITEPSRCFVHHPPEQPNTLVLFNFYGTTLTVFAMALKEIFRRLGFDINQVDLKNVTFTNKVNHEFPYINGGSGWLIGYLRQIAEVENLVFTDYSVDEYGSQYICENCNDEMGEDDVVFNRHQEVFCLACYNELYHYCEACDGEELVDESSRTVDGHIICQDCAENSYCQCDDCGLMMGSGHGIIFTAEDTDNRYCGNCYDRHLTECDRCNEVYEDSIANRYEFDNVPYCEECYEDLCEEQSQEEEQLELHI